MSSCRQIEADRRNALKNTGPKASVVMKRPFGAKPAGCFTLSKNSTTRRFGNDRWR
jgi:hypothetical protein